MQGRKSKVMVFERKEVEVANFGSQYRVSVPVNERCEIVMGGERMEVVQEFKYVLKNSIEQPWRDGRRNKGESHER